ncbi:MAG: hypothetical protein IJ637_00515 [Prevotella sp.]|nr:hypothetical protein [Prevotella sp.]
MRNFTKAVLALLVSMLGTVNTFAADQIADLEAEMFKAWTSDQPGATVVAEPDPEPKSNNAFGCSYALYETVGAYGTIYGSANVYYLWYADITGTKTMTVTGTTGMKIRLMLNREPYVEGGTGDADGGAYVELIQEIGEDGTTVFDFASYEYVHLNAIKVASGSTSGVVKSIQLLGSVKPVSGWVDMLNNGDLEGTDLSSFPVSKDGPNNGGTANDRPELTTLDGEKVMKVVADDLSATAEGWTTWSTQFFIKFNEPLPEGTQYRLVLDVKASENATISTSAQGEPRAWHAGFMDAFDVNNLEWKQLEIEGTVTADQGKDGGLGSVAFDLNNSNKPISFYFKNAHFYIYKEKNALGQFAGGFQYDVIRIDLGENTNMKELIAAAGGKRIIFPVDCASVKVNGQPSTLFSVEGKEDNKLYVFVDENYAEDENAKVEVSFTNPADAACHLKFISGRWEGEDVPNWADMLCAYQDGLGDNYTYLADIPELDSVDPEDGSFNLPLTMKTFKVAFKTNAQAAKLTAKLGNETLTVTPNEGLAKEFTLTRTGEGDIVAGEHILSITNVYPESEALGEDQVGSYEVTLNFGPVVVDPNDQPKDIVPASYFAEAANNSVPAGFKVVADNEEERNSQSTYGSGARVFSFADGGDFVKALYYRNNYVSYGEYEGYELELEQGKSYTVHFNTARWKSSGQWTKFQIISAADDEVELEEIVENNPDTNGGTGSPVKGSTVFEKKFSPAKSGKYILKWICASNSSGDQGTYNENLLANVWVKYIPNTVGADETQLLLTALENAKTVMEGNAAERYAGVDYTALQNLIVTVDAEKAGYTAPSSYKNAAAALDEAAQIMKDHRSACDTYDANIKKTIDIVRQTAAETDNGQPNAKRKFMDTPVYADVCAAADKYHGTSEWKNVAEPAPEGEPEAEPVWQLFYNFDILTDNDSLATANAELAEINDYAGNMFTVGASKTGTTGYAALNERIRLGIESLKSLGVAEDDELIVAAQKVLGDDDQTAEAIKTRIKAIVYGNLKNADNEMFKGIVDDQTLEETFPTYDMTVFVKNPNLYVTKAARKNLTTDNAPGWTVVEGSGYDVSWTTGWSQVGSDKIPADAMMSNYNKGYEMSQEITDLPAGEYTIKVGFGERESNGGEAGCFFFYTTSASTDSVKVYATVIGQAFPYDNLSAEKVLVVDGKLLVGVSATAGSHTFFNEIKLELTAPAAGFEYGKAYEEIAAGIDAAAAPAKVRAIQLFDLNGRRITTAKQGVVIVKKLMNDGTVRTEKVVVK